MIVVLKVNRLNTPSVEFKRQPTLPFQCFAVESKYRPDLDEVVRALNQLHDPKDMPRNADYKEHRLRGPGLSQTNGRPASGRGGAGDAPRNTAYPRPSALSDKGGSEV